MNAEKKIWSSLEEVLDPEVGVNIVDLGLVYHVSVDANRKARFEMTLHHSRMPTSYP